MTEAAQKLIDADVIDGLESIDKAKARISRACDDGRLKSKGQGRGRRIDEDSLNAFLLIEREKNLGLDGSG